MIVDPDGPTVPRPHLLSTVATAPNGDGVVLRDAEGAKFLVANDPRLAAATEDDLPRQLEMALQTFSPREIQARVRGGESAEVVAAETGWPLDKVLRYAEPLLAERAFIAEQAQSVEIRRSGGGATLLESATSRTRRRERRGPRRPRLGRMAARGRQVDRERDLLGRCRRAHAQWSYDHAGRNIHPLDDHARLLMGARPVAVPDPEVDIAEALDLIADIAVVREDAAEVRPHLVAVPDADDEADEDLEDAAGRDRPLRGAAAAPTHANETVTIAAPGPRPSPRRPCRRPRERKAPARKPKARKGRASVPSWDEILFGATKSDD